MQSFCICTLTDGRHNRDIALQWTIKTFLDNWKHDKFTWFIMVNETNYEMDQVIDWAQSTYPYIDWQVYVSPVNLGPGIGINKLNQLSKAYEYSLFIEGDWITLPDHVSGASGHWLQNSIKLLHENPMVDQVQFRRYLDDLDDRMYRFAHWIQSYNVLNIVDNGDIFYILKSREYVNTPTLRRMSTFYDKGIFPLDEFYDEAGNPLELKGNPEWGMAEINASRSELNGAWLQFGNFVHFEDWPYLDDWTTWQTNNPGCGLTFSGKTPCKYGFMVPNIFFCAACEQNEDITDIVAHNDRYLTHFLQLQQDNNSTDQQVLDKIRSVMANPTINNIEQLNINDKRDRYFRK